MLVLRKSEDNEDKFKLSTTPHMEDRFRPGSKQWSYKLVFNSNGHPQGVTFPRCDTLASLWKPEEHEGFSESSGNSLAATGARELPKEHATSSLVQESPMESAPSFMER